MKAFACFPLAALLLAVPVCAVPARAQGVRPPKHALAASDPQAVALLRRMIEAERTTAFIAREETFRNGETGTTHLVKSDPKRGVRREPLNGGKVQVARFDATGTDTPLRKQLRLRIEELGSRLMKGVLSARIVGMDTVAGRLCDIVEVRATRLPDAPTRRFFVDRAVGLRLRVEEKSATGKLLSGSYYTTLDLSPTFAPDDFTPPARTTATAGRKLFGERRRYKNVDDAKRAGLIVPVPGYVPSGFALRVVEGTPGGDVVTLRYANGLGVVSLTALRTGVPPRVRPLLQADGSAFLPNPQGKNGLFVRGANGGAFLVIGDLPEGELRKIAASLK